MLYVIMLALRDRSLLQETLNEDCTAVTAAATPLATAHPPHQGFLLYLSADEMRFEAVVPTWSETRSLILSRFGLCLIMS